MMWRTRSKSSATIRRGITGRIVLTGRPSSRSWPRWESTCPTKSAWCPRRGIGQVRPASVALAAQVSACGWRVRRAHLAPACRIRLSVCRVQPQGATGLRRAGHGPCRPSRCVLDRPPSSPERPSSTLDYSIDSLSDPDNEVRPHL